jgi:predicted metalloprotease with PDZ domain
VEHYNSTVIALGPGYRLMANDVYEELLGVSCHELFHTWNVKAIRPADMRPYDYDNENYSKLHYVTEGVTTYYGDLMLLKSGVWNLETYLRVFNNSVLKRHYGNNGRDHVTLEQASYDSWLVGYKSGVPNRKISFYTKGALAAFILDQQIREATGNARSLDTVMREMYQRFGKGEGGQPPKGYTRDDYKSIAEAHAGRDFDRYFEEVISGTEPLEDRLRHAANYFGLELRQRNTFTGHGKYLGLQLETNGAAAKIKQVHEGSPADKAGLHPGDEIVAVNGLRAGSANLGQLLMHFRGDEQVRLHFFRYEKLQQATLEWDEYETRVYMLVPQAHPSEAQLHNLIAWLRIDGYEDPVA